MMDVGLQYITLVKSSNAAIAYVDQIIALEEEMERLVKV